MVKYTKEEQRSAKLFLDEVEMNLDRRQRGHHNRADWHEEYGVTLEAWQRAIDEEGTHLSEQWRMLRDMRKQFGIK